MNGSPENGINYRFPFNQLHLDLNSGVKLLNFMSYGVPSISDYEPAYLELAPECTIFSTLNDLPEISKELQGNNDLYNKIRNTCLQYRDKFHINNIIKEYKKLFDSL